MDDKTWIDKEKFLSEYRRELRSWKTIIDEGIKCAIPTEEVIKDNERYHGRAIGFLVALKCLPLSVMPDDEIETLREELLRVMYYCNEQVDIYNET